MTHCLWSNSLYVNHVAPAVSAGSYDHTVRVFDGRTDRSIMNMDHGQPVESVLLFPSEGLLVSAGKLAPLTHRSLSTETRTFFSP